MPRMNPRYPRGPSHAQQDSLQQQRPREERPQGGAPTRMTHPPRIPQTGEGSTAAREWSFTPPGARRADRPRPCLSSGHRLSPRDPHRGAMIGRVGLRRADRTSTRSMSGTPTCPISSRSSSGTSRNSRVGAGDFACERSVRERPEVVPSSTIESGSSGRGEANPDTQSEAGRRPAGVDSAQRQNARRTAGRSET
jgi:hypothetical protein